MIRLIALLFLLPTYAAADWSPRPTMFSYDATFNQCTLDADTPDPARLCAERLASAFAVKRAATRATQACLGQDLATCSVPFEEEGLTAIAARIAADTGCTNSDLSDWPEFVPLPEDHCTPLIADILIDEGVVPLQSEIACDTEGSECVYLAQLQVRLWSKAIRALDDGPNLYPTVRDHWDRIGTECRAQSAAATDAGTPLPYDALSLCIAGSLAHLWQDLSSEE